MESFKVYKKLSEEEKKKILRKLEKYFRKFRFVKGIIVFGSFVERSYFRDIDIVLLTGGKINEERILEMIVELEKEIGIEVDIKVWEELPLSFKFEVLKKGKPIFVPKHFEKERWLIVKEYFDFLPFKERNDRRLWGL